MLTISPGWDLEVERGPDWLFVKLGNRAPADSDIPSLADEIWSILDRHFVYRLVLQLDGVHALNRDLLRELVVLYRRVRHHGGMMRLCGLTAQHCKMLEDSGLTRRFPAYQDLLEAVMGDSRKPR
jgi:anti-anti-sigma regulatory factor